MPAQLLIRDRMRAAFGPATDIRFTDVPARAWVRDHGETGWIGVQLPPVLRETLTYGLGLLLTAALAVLFTAWWFARHLTRPLVRLEKASERITQGEDPSDSDRSAPREVRALQAALVQSAAKVREAARDRELLLAGVSHDLRTPLARLRLALELEPGLVEAERQLLIGDVEEMDAIIGQFLDYVRDGRDEAVESRDISGLLSELVESAARSGHIWRLTSPEHFEARIRPLSLRRALGNLMRNAERHGAVPFELSLKAGAGELRILVRDGGPGLPETVLAQIGRPFLRADPAHHGSSGTGLGLSLVQRVALAHGGRFELHNRLGGGLDASLVLPIAP
jgi:two-component system osmolarity sensor histidine kinase EnvZ